MTVTELSVHDSVMILHPCRASDSHLNLLLELREELAELLEVWLSEQGSEKGLWREGWTHRQILEGSSFKVQ